MITYPTDPLRWISFDSSSIRTWRDEIHDLTICWCLGLFCNCRHSCPCRSQRPGRLGSYYHISCDWDRMDCWYHGQCHLVRTHLRTPGIVVLILFFRSTADEPANVSNEGEIILAVERIESLCSLASLFLRKTYSLRAVYSCDLGYSIRFGCRRWILPSHCSWCGPWS